MAGTAFLVFLLLCYICRLLCFFDCCVICVIGLSTTKQKQAQSAKHTKHTEQDRGLAHGSWFFSLQHIVTRKQASTRAVCSFGSLVFGRQNARQHA
jgi:hypothetical protein